MTSFPLILRVGRDFYSAFCHSAGIGFFLRVLPSRQIFPPLILAKARHFVPLILRVKRNFYSAFCPTAGGGGLGGGGPEAERRVLCLEPEYSYGECPVRCVQLQCRALPGAALPAHKDYLGSLMGLALKREALGDILLPADAPGTAYVFALEPAAKLICRELCQAGRTEVSTRLLEPEEIPAFPAPERQLLTATVSSLRLDAVLSAMLHVSRGTAAELIEAGRVEINHLPVEKPHAPVYEQDVFTVRGKGRFRLTALPGKSKKDRSIIEFFQY